MPKNHHRQKKNTILYVLYDWCEISSVHPIPRIKRSKNLYLRFLWLFCLTASAVYCVYSIVVSIMAYRKYEKFTSTEIIKESSSNFPAISFCYYKMLNKLSQRDFQQTFSNNEQTNDIYDYVNENLLSMQNANRTDFNQTLDLADQRLVGLTLKNILISCVYNRRQCFEKDFSSFFHPIHGNCFTFNNNLNGSIKTSRIQGPGNGLTLELLVGTSNEKNDFLSNDGIILVVHNQTKIPFFDSDRILINTGVETDLKINRNFISKLGPPFNDCLEENTKNTFKSEIMDHIVNDLNKTYSQQHCYSLCMQKYIIDECNCSSIWLPINYKNTKFCNYKKIDCITYATRQIFSKKKNSVCIKQCPLECNIIEYKISSSRISFPSEYYKRQLIKNNKKINSSGVSYSEIQNSMLKINIFYESLTYNLIKESESLTIETLFANIGGTLSLTLGISISSVIEIAELVISLIQAYREKKNIARI
jgi:hypothetical protein